jgi:hypothetical protein
MFDTEGKEKAKMKLRRTFPIFLILALFLGNGPTTEGDDHRDYTRRGGTRWSYQVVDSVGLEGGHTSLALDAAGNAHISYYDGDTRDLKYARWTGTAWDIQTVDGEGGDDVGQHTSLALDAAGRPHISYYDVTRGNLKYARWTGTTWATQAVEAGGDVGTNTSLALDAAGNPHISYSDRTNYALKYAHWTGGTWDIQTLASLGIQPYHTDRDTSLALDSAGQPHISFSPYISYYGPDFALNYARWTGSTWDIQTVAKWGNRAKYSSLALDTAGQPHISYSYLDIVQQDRQDGLRYAYWMGSAWEFQTVDSGYVGAHTSLALDAAGHAHISYQDHEGTMDKLKYAHWTGSDWAIQTVDPDWRVHVGEHTSLALDAAGLPHISYRAGTNLKYARLISTARHVLVPLALHYDRTVLSLRLDEPEGATTFRDSSIYQNDGTCSGGSCPRAGVPGKANTALRFDGVDDYINLGNPASMNIDGQVSIEAWVNFQAADGIRNVVAHGYTRSPDAEVSLRVQDGRYEVGSWDGTSHKAWYNIPAKDLGRWVHLAGTYDGTAWRLFRNGVEVASTAEATGAVSVNGNWAIGARGTGTERFYQGLLDEVAIYNQALSPQEIQNHYQGTLGQRTR